jgi:hypothetical protein
MIIPFSLMIKSDSPIESIECKIFCNRDEYPTNLVMHGEHLDIYHNKNLYFSSIESVFDCKDYNELMIIWPIRPKSKLYEIDDIEIDFLYIDKPKLLKESSFLHVQTDLPVARPIEFSDNHWTPGTLINNPGVFYMNFTLPITTWCFAS